jgi:nucleotide-binding universal stress UspA family protein
MLNHDSPDLPVRESREWCVAIHYERGGGPDDTRLVYRAQKIVVGYDGSESAKRALDRAAGLTGYGSLLTVVTVASSPSELEQSSHLLAEATDRLLVQRVFARPLERVGNVADELIATVRELDADLLILGNGKNALQRLLLGSVSSTLVHRAPCDVLVTR